MSERTAESNNKKSKSNSTNINNDTSSNNSNNSNTSNNNNTKNKKQQHKRMHMTYNRRAKSASPSPSEEPSTSNPRPSLPDSSAPPRFLHVQRLQDPSSQSLSTTSDISLQTVHEQQSRMKLPDKSGPLTDKEMATGSITSAEDESEVDSYDFLEKNALATSLPDLSLSDTAEENVDDTLDIEHNDNLLKIPKL